MQAHHISHRSCHHVINYSIELGMPDSLFPVAHHTFACSHAQNEKKLYLGRSLPVYSSFCPHLLGVTMWWIHVRQKASGVAAAGKIEVYTTITGATFVECRHKLVPPNLVRIQGFSCSATANSIRRCGIYFTVTMASAKDYTEACASHSCPKPSILLQQTIRS